MKLPDVPPYMASLAERARFQSGDEAGGIMVVETMIANMDDGTLKDETVIRLKLLLSEPILREYDEACLAFKEKFGRMPKDGKEIFDAGLAKAEPINKIDEPIIVDEKC